MITAYVLSKTPLTITNMFTPEAIVSTNQTTAQKYDYHAPKLIHEELMKAITTHATTNISDILFDFENIDDLTQYLINNHITKQYVTLIGIHNNGTNDFETCMKAIIDKNISDEYNKYKAIYAIVIHITPDKNNEHIVKHTLYKIK